MRTAARRVLFFAALVSFAGGYGHAAKSAGDVPLRIAAATIPVNKNNPYDSPAIMHMWFYAAVYDALTFITKTGEVVPWLATAWERPTPNIWIIKLRGGVVFSDGTPLTSHVVKKKL